MNQRIVVSTPKKVSSLQERIVKKYGHLRPAAIPVQDLHLTLFVASFKEEDGTLEVRR